MHFPDRKPFRKRTNWIAALAAEAAALPLRAWAQLKTGKPYPPARWRKALVLGDNHIGDLLYRSASLGHLKKGLPHCELHYLAAPGACEVLAGHPAITQILPWLRSDSSFDLAPEHFSALSAMQFDAALCTNCIRYWPELLLALRLKIPNRAGYTYKGFSGWVTHPIPIRYPDSYSAYFRNYAGVLAGLIPDWSLRPLIFPTVADEAAAEEVWGSAGLDRHAQVIACFMTTRQPTGIWPAENFGKTLALLRQETGSGIVLCGSDGDGPLLERINRDFGLDAAVLAGSLRLRALYCFLRRCTAVLATDSGARHIANAAGVPVYFFRNLRSNPIETGAYLPSEVDLCPLVGWLKPEQHPDVLAGITPGQAAEAVAKSLVQVSPRQ